MTVVRDVFRILYGSTSNSTHVGAQVAILVAIRDFVISLLQALVIQESGVGVSELHNLIGALAKLAVRPGSPECFQQLLETARDVSANTPALGDDYNNVESMTADPHGFHDQVSMLVNKWYRIYEATGTNGAFVTRFER
ncbi:hypothetical protein MKW92_020116 [Papaver armeniacum]|nr:hypothetical protein MKW92_020116 [Papaver armeniacum]